MSTHSDPEELGKLKEKIIGVGERLLKRNHYPNLKERISELERTQGQLKQLARRYELILKSAGEGIVGLDAQGNVTFINQAAATMLGYEEDEIIGKNSHATWHYRKPDGALYPIKECPLYAAYRDGTVHSGEEVFIRKDGAGFPVDFKSIPLQEDGIIGSVITFRDITEHLKAEEALRMSEANYRAIFDSVNDAIFVHDVNTGEVISVNRRTSELFGYALGDLRDFSVETLFSQVCGYAGQDVLQKIRLAAEEFPQVFEWLGRKKDGQLFWVEVGLRRAVIGGVTRVLAVVRDITDRKEAESRLKESETNLRTILDSVYDAVFIHNLDGTILDVNRKMLELYGVDREQALSSTILDDFSAPENPFEKVSEIWNKALAGQDQIFEWKAKRPNDGSVFDVEVFLHKITFQAREVILASVRDITMRKRAEEALKLTQFSVDHASVSAFLVDTEARLLYVNEEACRSLGYTCAELLKKKITDLDQSFPAPVWDEHWAQLKKEGSLHFETLHRKKDGSLLPVEVSANYVSFGGREYNWGFARDISERKEVEKKIAGLNRQKELILESAGDGIFGMDSDGNHILVNSAGSKMLDYTPEELIGRHSHSLWHHTRADGRPYPADECLIYKTRNDGISRHVDSEVFWRKDGSSIPVEYVTTPIVEGDGIVGSVVSFRDITERRRTEEALRMSESRFRNLFRQSSISMQIFSPDGRTLEVNDAWEKLWRLDREAAHQYNILEDQQLIAKGVMPFIQKGFSGETTEIPAVMYDPSEIEHTGRARWVKAFIYPVKNAEGNVHQVVLLHWDITEMVKAQEALHESENRFRAFFESAGVGMAQVDPATRKFFRVNQEFCRLTGFSSDELRSMTFSDLIHPEDRMVDAEKFAEALRSGTPVYEAEKRYVRKDGRIIWVHVSATVVRDSQGRPVHTAGVVHDITDRKRMEEEIKHMAHHDPLTGLPNRRLFNEIAGVELAQAERNNKKLAILFLDLDRFKEVNDTLGHHAGDQLLMEVAYTIKNSIRKSDTVARIGGDEFNVILADIQRLDSISVIASKLTGSFRKPFDIADHELHITTSIGISVYPDDGDNIDTLLRYADIAMYHAKESGRNNYQFYNPSINIRSIERMRLEGYLRQAIERSELSVYYQPQIDIISGKMVCAEALVRWNHPKKGLLEPKEFLPLAEETGLIVSIDQWVLNSVCRQVRAWVHSGFSPVCITVNLSARQFQSPSLVSSISSILDKTGMSPDSLDLEITETTAMSNIERTASHLRELVDMGIHISVDDFGTGYSSLNYLKKLPIERLKIDQSFIHDITTDADDRAIITAVTSMARSMSIRTVAEGVETEEQLAFLRKTGCDEAQGFLFSRPVHAERFSELLTHRT